ncbi:MAG: SEC-C metal-binding domain-containing protein [Acidobacteriota bacterium]
MSIASSASWNRTADTSRARPSKRRFGSGQRSRRTSCERSRKRPSTRGRVFRTQPADPFRAPAGRDDSGVSVRSAPRVGRNAPCPCGSGKKYKKCCEAG